MSIRSIIKDIDSGKQGRAVAKVAKHDIGFQKNGGLEHFEGSQVGLPATELRRAMIMSLAKGDELRAKDSNGEQEKARASDKTFRRSVIRRMIDDREEHGPDFKDEHKEAEMLRKYLRDHPCVFF